MNNIKQISIKILKNDKIKLIFTAIGVSFIIYGGWFKKISCDSKKDTIAERKAQIERFKSLNRELEGINGGSEFKMDLNELEKGLKEAQKDYRNDPFCKFLF